MRAADLRARAALVAAALVPFVPAALQFVRLGVPDYLFTGDGATIELRVLHASRGAQFVGAYSRFFWSHPGPAFFYLALPVYEVFHEHGPALNLFMLAANAFGAGAIVLIARRLRGDAFAWLTAALLAVFELIALPFVQTGEWNPVSPILPLVLLSFLTARLALGGLRVLPAFVFVSSAIVQTHVGFAPEVAALCAVAIAPFLGDWLRHAWTRSPAPAFGRRERFILAGSGVVLAACWILPLYEAATNRPGNIAQLVEFFSGHHRVHLTWETVFTTVFAQLSAVPVAVARSVHLAIATPGPMVAEAIAIAMLVVAVAAAAAAMQTRDRALGVFAAIALAEMIAAVAAVRAVRGELLPYLVFWVAVPGLMTLVAGAAWLARPLERLRIAAIAPAIAVIALTMTVQPAAPAFREQNIAVERLARDVETYIRAEHLERPTVRVGSGDAWPAAAAVILHLRKQQIPISVEQGWLFMFGRPFAPDGAPHASIVVADRAFEEQARLQPQLTRIATDGETAVYVEPPGFFDSRRLPPPALQSAAGIDRDPRLAVDGALPPDGEQWDGPASAIFRTTDSAIVVAVPSGDVAGFFASVDGNDLYVARCVGGPERSWPLGVHHPEQGVVGLHTRIAIDSAIAQCRAIELRPQSGDGLYSVGEIGFLRR